MRHNIVFGALKNYDPIHIRGCILSLFNGRAL